MTCRISITSGALAKPSDWSQKQRFFRSFSTFPQRTLIGEFRERHYLERITGSSVVTVLVYLKKGLDLAVCYPGNRDWVSYINISLPA